MFFATGACSIVLASAVIAPQRNGRSAF